MLAGLALEKRSGSFSFPRLDSDPGPVVRCGAVIIVWRVLKVEFFFSRSVDKYIHFAASLQFFFGFVNVKNFMTNDYIFIIIKKWLLAGGSERAKREKSLPTGTPFLVFFSFEFLYVCDDGG